MKRPKLEDMTQVEEARFRLLQARRAALRVLDKLSAVEMEALPPSSREDYERIRVVAETTIAITEPDWGGDRAARAGAGSRSPIYGGYRGKQDRSPDRCQFWHSQQ
jgi:hypothetical protein